MNALTTVLELTGLALIVAGIALWCLPVALVAAGVGLIVLSWRLAGARPARRGASQ